MVNNKLDTTEPSKLPLESGFDLDLKFFFFPLPYQKVNRGSHLFQGAHY